MKEEGKKRKGKVKTAVSLLNFFYLSYLLPLCYLSIRRLLIMQSKLS